MRKDGIHSHAKEGFALCTIHDSDEVWSRKFSESRALRVPE